MFLFQRMLRAIRSWFQRKQSANFTLNMETIRSLQFIAERERLTPEEVADRILIDVIRDHLAQEDNWQRWHNLTPREQEVAALVCLNYTTRQIAAKLHISPETVKTHVEHVLGKFDVQDRNILRLLLSGWDFSGWDRFS
ncbi:MAG: helix-turn-helix transcriptional regulator [Anaerolineaceae bacterium]|nr:helix-turn-helix transcriptional regulator [Anaerolineaceae bacterium]